VDQNVQQNFRPTRKESCKCTCPILNIFIRSGDIRRRILKSSEIGPNFACFWPLKFFWGGLSEILDRYYKT